MKAIENGSFALLWVSIVGISVHDGLLVLAHRGIIADAELNPVGSLLLRWNGGDIWYLLAAKAVGTVSAAAVLLVLYWKRPRIGWIVCAATAAFQALLLLFLYFG
jgi:hypothetical protein